MTCGGAGMAPAGQTQTASGRWLARYNYTAVVFDGKMWVLGGDFQNDVWWSSNGASWTEITASNHWSARYGHIAVVFDEQDVGLGR